MVDIIGEIEGAVGGAANQVISAAESIIPSSKSTTSLPTPFVSTPLPTPYVSSPVTTEAPQTINIGGLKANAASVGAVASELDSLANIPHVVTLGLIPSYSPGASFMKSYGGTDTDPYGAFSQWSNSAQKLVTGISPAQYTAYEQTPEFKNAPWYEQLGEGIVKTITNPQSVMSYGTQGAALFAGSEVLGPLAASSRVLGILNSPLARAAEYGGYTGLGLYNAAGGVDVSKGTIAPSVGYPQFFSNVGSFIGATGIMSAAFKAPDVYNSLPSYNQIYNAIDDRIYAYRQSKMGIISSGSRVNIPSSLQYVNTRFLQEPETNIPSSYIPKDALEAKMMEVYGTTKPDFYRQAYEKAIKIPSTFEPLSFDIGRAKMMEVYGTTEPTFYKQAYDEAMKNARIERLSTPKSSVDIGKSRMMEVYGTTKPTFVSDAIKRIEPSYYPTAQRETFEIPKRRVVTKYYEPPVLNIKSYDEINNKIATVGSNKPEVYLKPFQQISIGKDFEKSVDDATEKLRSTFFEEIPENRNIISINRIPSINISDIPSSISEQIPKEEERELVFPVIDFSPLISPSQQPQVKTKPKPEPSVSTFGIPLPSLNISPFTKKKKQPSKKTKHIKETFQYPFSPERAATIEARELKKGSLIPVPKMNTGGSFRGIPMPEPIRRKPLRGPITPASIYNERSNTSSGNIGIHMISYKPTLHIPKNNVPVNKTHQSAGINNRIPNNNLPTGSKVTGSKKKTLHSTNLRSALY